MALYTIERMSPSLRPVCLSLAVVRAERVLLGCVLMYRCYPAFISQLSAAFSSTDVGLAAAIAAGSREYGWWCLFVCVDVCVQRPSENPSYPLVHDCI